MFYHHKCYLDDCILFVVSYHALEHHHCAIAAGLAGFSEYVKGVLCHDQGQQELQVQKEEMTVLNHHFLKGMADYRQNYYLHIDL